MKTFKNNDVKMDVHERNSKKYYDLIEECENNINSVVEEANLLFNNGFYARCFVLAYSALEELGKRLIIADYMTGIVSKEELDKAFNDHKIKIAYLNNNAKMTLTEDGKNKVEIVYDINKYKSWISERHTALYVDINNDTIVSPTKKITKEYAENIMKYLKNKIQSTNYYESVNGKIGSKAFYK